MEYDIFFEAAIGNGHTPLPFQERIALEEKWPDFLDVETGLGKTAAVTVGWLYRKMIRNCPDTPSKLIWCLPMRGLGEQTHENIVNWVSRLKLDDRVDVYLLMGGSNDILRPTWAETPEKPTILIGTQDMLLSRALMRGYGMSRYQWPVHFALLHNDALWVYDEIQLMGPALATTAQLEAFRKKWHPAKPCRSLWVSATLRQEWLATVDLKPHLSSFRMETLNNDDKAHPLVKKRIGSRKQLLLSQTVLRKETKKGYEKTLAAEILREHCPGTQTLVILNQVERCQNLYKQLRKSLKKSATKLLLIHGRFRRKERKTMSKALGQIGCDRIIIATQAIEAGVDISSTTLFTELALWAALVQRFGRNNRLGEDEDARIFLIDMDEDYFAAPYPQQALTAAREFVVQTMKTENGNAGPESLPGITNELDESLVIRSTDFLELFNTDPDLTGYDIDISPYIRDTGTPSLLVFWRDFEETTTGIDFPMRDELCPVSITMIKKHMNKAGAWRLNSLSENKNTWIKTGVNDIRPGMTLLLKASEGGYSEEMGFLPAHKTPVDPVKTEMTPETEKLASDDFSMIGCFVPLDLHLKDAEKEAKNLCLILGEPDEIKVPVVLASRRHDTGKAHPAFQYMLTCDQPPPQDGLLWAKSADFSRNPNYIVPPTKPDQKESRRKYFRHELASMLSWLENEDGHELRDLVAFLIAAHHGKVRMGLRAVPGETHPDDHRLFARGIWEGDILPEIPMGDDLVIPETRLRLDLMQLGEGEMGPSWSSRTQALLMFHGPFRLAWMEALVRLADWRASSREASKGGNQ